MIKEEFLAMSLPHNLKYIDLQCEPDDNLCLMTGIQDGLVCDEQGNFNCKPKDCLPILRPLSDLTKEITHKGEAFVPIEKLYHLDIMRCDISSFESINIDVVADHIFSNQFLKFTLKLIEWHFDLFGGIDSGEAINVNTLDKNPYK